MDKKLGWLVIGQDDLQPIEVVWDEEEPLLEPPYSDDNGILQFRIAIDFNPTYPQLTVVEEDLF